MGKILHQCIYFDVYLRLNNHIVSLISRAVKNEDNWILGRYYVHMLLLGYS